MNGDVLPELPMPRSLHALLLSLSLLLPAQAASYRIETLAEGLEHPWSLALLPDGSMLVSERAGRLRVIENGQLRPAPVEGVPAVYASGQGGLLELLPHPDFAGNRWLYLSYAHGAPRANALRVARARFDGERLSDLQVLFTATPEKATPVHYGGRMAWMADASLLVAGGDGFDYREQAQSLQSHLGKIVRIGADGGAPTDNPFAGRSDALPEIWSLGHRNVQGLVVDADGTVWAHEHGPRGGDELNRIVPGGNYGWPLATHGLDYSGARISPFTTREDMIDAVHGWTPSIAPAGMIRYGGEAFPDLRGRLLVTALAGRSLRALKLEAGRVVDEARWFEDLGERLRDVREGPDGELYLLTDDAKGRVLRVLPE
jgi:aldose sugar dehydrogenase